MKTLVAPPPLTVPVQRICSEYLEMPGLRLNSRQAQRLLGLPPSVCAEALQFLVDAGFLRCTENGQYLRLTEGAVRPPEYPAEAVKNAALSRRSIA
jgi:hypothetical protein